MPAQKPAAGESPAQSLTSITAKFDWFRDHFLPLSVSIILIIVLFFFGFELIGRQQGDLTKLVGNTNLFENVNDQSRFEEFITGETADSFIKSFVYLSDEYTHNPSNEKRNALINLSNYISSNFPREARGANLEIPCREESCGAVYGYSEELLGIKNNISQNLAINDIERDVLLVNIENAALALGGGDRESAFSNLSTTFQNLKSIWQATGDERVRNLASNLLPILENTSSESYGVGLQIGTFNLE